MKLSQLRLIICASCQGILSLDSREGEDSSPEVTPKLWFQALLKWLLFGRPFFSRPTMSDSLSTLATADVLCLAMPGGSKEPVEGQYTVQEATGRHALCNLLQLDVTMFSKFRLCTLENRG